MTYEKTIDWLFHQFPAYQFKGELAYKPDLDNVLFLCKHFDIKYNSLKFIHVAGTNGKGSTSNMLASILQESKYKVGLFTSPHILDFRERIRVNGEKISKDKVVEFCLEIQKKSFDIKPSFFEITWVLALRYFIDKNCEICVIETGLGGRLDATNIIHPILSIITSISMDHQNILGNTLPQIAFEKAGIIKSHTPVVIGQVEQDIKSVFIEKTKNEQATIFFVDDLKKSWDTFFPSESYLAKNEILVRFCCEKLTNLGLDLTNENIENGIVNTRKNTGFIGRFDVLQKKPYIILDAAHNVDGIKHLLKSLQNFQYQNLLVIYGASKDKNLKDILTLFPQNTRFIFSTFTNERSQTLENYKAICSKLNLKANFFTKISEAFEFSKNIQNEQDIILITGSFFLISDFYSFFSNKNL